MEFILSRNYTNVMVTDKPSQEYVSVMVGDDEFNNLRYGGVLMASEAIKRANGYFSYFRLNPAYRVRFGDSFTYSTDDNTLVSFVEGSVVYVLMEENNRPSLWKRDRMEGNKRKKKPEGATIVDIRKVG